MCRKYTDFKWVKDSVCCVKIHRCLLVTVQYNEGPWVGLYPTRCQCSTLSSLSKMPGHLSERWAKHCLLALSIYTIHFWLERFFDEYSPLCIVFFCDLNCKLWTYERQIILHLQSFYGYHSCGRSTAAGVIVPCPSKRTAVLSSIGAFCCGLLIPLEFLLVSSSEKGDLCTCQ